MYDTPPPTPRQPCACCGRRTTSDRVAPACIARMHDELAYLLPALRALPLAMVPGRGGGEKVRTSRSAPLPLRVDPLSLAAGGGEVRDAYVPAVESEPAIKVVRGEQVTVIVRRRVMVPADDQAGSLPLVAWASAWVADWRAEFGHAPAAAPAPRLVPPTVIRPVVGAGWLRTPVARTVLIGYLAAVRDAARREIARDVLGLGDASALPDGADPDPSAREWAIRFGQPSESLALAQHVGYLRTWLPHAAEEHPDIALFARALSALVKACRFVLGDIDDRSWLGRCPTGYRTHDGQIVGRLLHDRDSGDEIVCGAGLWHEPATSKLVCPRCGTETDSRGLLPLSGHIRQAWPVDRRRRYTTDEADALAYAAQGQRPDLRMPTCGDCGRAIGVRWKPATERSDTQRMWRIDGTYCPARCGEDEGSVAA